MQMGRQRPVADANRRLTGRGRDEGCNDEGCNIVAADRRAWYVTFSGMRARESGLICWSAEAFPIFAAAGPFPGAPI
jgi:hypothetical protein